LRVYRPEGAGPFPATVFLHGCSGPTRSHEEDWARFHRDRGVVLIAVDSLAPRDLDGQGVCDLEVLTGRERAADVLTILAHARGLPFVDRDRLALMGFSHGAWTIWELFVLASHQRPPLGLAQWPEGGLDGVRAAFLFYGPCLETWTVRIPTLAFLASADRYIDEQACIGYAQRQEAKREADAAPFFSYRLFEGATHTFDHARPNAANREAGSIYDPRATRAAQDEIERRMDAFLQPAGRGKTGSVRTGSVGRHAASPLP
jgi:dienelactone hydrolase